MWIQRRLSPKLSTIKGKPLIFFRKEKKLVLYTLAIVLTLLCFIDNISDECGQACVSLIRKRHGLHAAKAAAKNIRSKSEAILVEGDNYYYSGGEYFSRAKAAYKKSIELKKDSRAYMGLAKIAIKENECQDALEQLLLALDSPRRRIESSTSEEIWKTQYSIINYLGLSLLCLDRHEDALEVLNKANGQDQLHVHTCIMKFFYEQEKRINSIQEMTGECTYPSADITLIRELDINRFVDVVDAIPNTH